MSSKQEQMWNNLKNSDFRKQFIDEHISVGLAFQIRSLRNRQNLTQGDLANLMGIKQSLVSAWENPNYGKYNLGTLKELANAFDVGLMVRFVPFSLLVDRTVNLKSDDIAPPNFDEEESHKVSFNALMAEVQKIIDAKQSQSEPTQNAEQILDTNFPGERILQHA